MAAARDSESGEPGLMTDARPGRRASPMAMERADRDPCSRGPTGRSARVQLWTQRDDGSRLDQVDFSVEPRLTRSSLGAGRFLVHAALASRLPFEMFDDVRQIDVGRIDSRLHQRA